MPLFDNSNEDPTVKDQISFLNNELGKLQREAIQLKIPIVILFEGVDGAGKGALINRLLLSLDPRNFKVHAMHSPNEEALYRPFLWRFWIKTPKQDQMTIFDRSWYRHLIDDRVEELLEAQGLPDIFEDINNFERQLADDGVLIIKLYLSISMEEQRSRFEKLEKSATTAWRVTQKDWLHHAQYDNYQKMVSDMIEKTNSEMAPWHIIDSSSIKSATIKLLEWVSNKITKAIEEKKLEEKPVFTSELQWRSHAKKDSPLDPVDLSQSLELDDYQKRMNILQEKVYNLEHLLYLSRRPMVLVFEGWDAAGKGGAIRRLVKGLDPRGYEVIPVGAPNADELNHHYLWRFWNSFPKGGHIAIYDRSWYGRVMVERLEGFCTEKEWKAAYQEINEMESHWAKCGTIILKFWIHIDQDEQLARFNAREENPLKRWKITEEDWRNREKWDDYKIAVEDMIQLTDEMDAPWVVVEGNNKRFARVKVLETTVKAIESVLC